MSSAGCVETTGIYVNEETQCYEAWVVHPQTDDRVLVATCSTCVSDSDYHWWVETVWNAWMPDWGVQRGEVRVA